MATGPENYRRAEELVRSVRDGRQIGDGVAQIFAAAQARATLADYDEWVTVASLWKPRQKGGDA
ncbi:hypothetical protein AB0E06_38325 [Streptomyces sp. NPDC048109]|uniref:hypothetical protein n=1 Tax=Streptomyces sp. NPDC048109 TaxID=3155482 RepID=UPI003422A1DE